MISKPEPRFPVPLYLHFSLCLCHHQQPALCPGTWNVILVIFPPRMPGNMFVLDGLNVSTVIQLYNIQRLLSLYWNTGRNPTQWYSQLQEGNISLWTNEYILKYKLNNLFTTSGYICYPSWKKEENLPIQLLLYSFLMVQNGSLDSNSLHSFLTDFILFWSIFCLMPITTILKRIHINIA